MPKAKKAAPAAMPTETITAYKGFNPDWTCRGFRFEEWRPIPGFSGLYEVSSEGRVRSLPRKTATGLLGGRHLKPESTRNGYLRVTLSADGRARRLLLHRLVLMAFAGSATPEQECRHLDGDRTNCRRSNLTWGSRSENARDRVIHGTQVDTRGERHGMTRLLDAEAIDIVRCRRRGMKLSEIAQRFSISIATACRISNGSGWKHIKTEIV